MSEPVPAPGLATLFAPTVRRIGLTAVLGLVQHWLRRRSPATTERARRRWWLGAAIAMVGPVVNYRRATRNGAVRWQWPDSAIGRTLLVTHVTAAALTEELVWRGPLTVVRRPWLRVALAAVGGAGFVASHLPKDGGRGVPFHLTNTASWTASVLCNGGVAASATSHTAYNLVAVAVHPVDGPSTRRDHP